MFYVCPASEWKEDIEWIAHHTHSDVKKYAAQLVCDCSNKLALRKSKQPWSQDRMFLTCYKKECGFFLWIDQPISHGIKDRLSYSPQPRVTRLQPYGEIKEMFEKHRQEAKQKAFIQHQRHTRKCDEGFEMCDNGFNSLGNTYLFNVMLSPLKNVKRLKTINSYLLILERLHKVHADQNVLLCLTL